MKFLNFFSIAIISFLLHACAYAITDLDSMTNPSYQGFRAKTIIVDARQFPLKQQKLLESYIKDNLSKAGVNAYKGVNSWPPFKDYTQEEIYNIARSKHADAILSIEMTYRNKREVTQETTFGTASGLSNNIAVSKRQALAQMDIKISLIDPRTGDKIWIASGNSQGTSEIIDDDDLVNSIAKQVVSSLKDDGII